MSHVEHAESGRAPATDAEKTVARIWAEILGIDEINTTDDFFELGGHSLLAVQVMSRLQDEFGGPRLSIRLLIDAPTMGELARAVERS